MRLVLVCSSLEPGRDGVGDYSRRLAGELIRQGHSARVAALNDSYVSKPLLERQEIEGTSVSVLRLPNTLPWNERAVEVTRWLKEFAPDWISLQFVPFGFHPKGFCFGVGNALLAIKTKASWHVMFHELWLGLGNNSSIKERLWGEVQGFSVRGFTKRLRPKCVHTQTEPYRIVLRREGIKASILPLFGNIPPVKRNGADDLMNWLLAKSLGKLPDRSQLYLAGIFGWVHPEWNVEQTVNALLPLVQRSRRQLVLVFFGKNNLTPERVAKLKVQLGYMASIVVVGEKSGAEISQILQALDLGLATSPRQVIQKSGSVAAMLEHGLSVLVTRDDWRLRGCDAAMEPMSARLLSPQQLAAMETLPMRDPQLSQEHSVGKIARQFLETLHQS